MDNNDIVVCPRCGFNGSYEDFEKGFVFNFFNKEYAEDMIKFLNEVPPKPLAIILLHMHSDVAGKILIGLSSQKLQKDVIKIICELTEMDFDSVQKLDKILRQRTKTEDKIFREFSGIDYAIDILHTLDKDTLDRILQQLIKELGSRSSYKIIYELFSEKVRQIGGEELVEIFQEIPTETIAYAVMRCRLDLKNEIYNNLPERRKDAILTEIENMPDKINIKVVTNAQKLIIEEIQKKINQRKEAEENN